jgi:hypothetical protein
MDVSRPRKAAQPGNNEPSAESPDEIPEWLERVKTAVESEPPVMRILMMRAIHAVLKFSTLSEASALNATTAPTDLAVLIRALSSGELIDDLKKVEPLAPAFIRGIEAKRHLIEDYGGAFTAEQVAMNLGISRQGVEKRRRAGKLIAVTTGRHGYRYPVWQFSDSGTLPGLDEVLSILRPRHDEWMQVAFFLGADHLLDGDSPLDSLKAGKLEQVLNAAQLFGEHGAM